MAQIHFNAVKKTEVLAIIERRKAEAAKIMYEPGRPPSVAEQAAAVWNELTDLQSEIERMEQK